MLCWLALGVGIGHCQMMWITPWEIFFHVDCVFGIPCSMINDAFFWIVGMELGNVQRQRLALCVVWWAGPPVMGCTAWHVFHRLTSNLCQFCTDVFLQTRLVDEWEVYSMQRRRRLGFFGSSVYWAKQWSADQDNSNTVNDIGPVTQKGWKYIIFRSNSGSVKAFCHLLSFKWLFQVSVPLSIHLHSTDLILKT